MDRLLPNVPLRQYVLAFPYDLSGLAASRPKVLTYLSHVFWEALQHRYAAWAKTHRGASSSQRVETGAFDQNLAPGPVTMLVVSA